jgi:hypothetical protein
MASVHQLRFEIIDKNMVLMTRVGGVINNLQYLFVKLMPSTLSEAEIFSLAVVVIAVVGGVVVSHNINHA